MLVNYKILTTSDEGTRTIIEKKRVEAGKPGETFNDVKARFILDMRRVFPDGPFDTKEYFIEECQ